MNIYDTKIIRCIGCDKQIGEIDYDARVIGPICGQCDVLKPGLKNQQSNRKENPITKKMEKPISV